MSEVVKPGFHSASKGHTFFSLQYTLPFIIKCMGGFFKRVSVTYEFSEHDRLCKMREAWIVKCTPDWV